MSFFIGWHMLDIFFLLLGCYFVIKGAFCGFVGEILSFGGLVLSVYIGFRHSSLLGSLLSGVTGLNREIALVLSVILVWLIVSITFAVFRRMLKKVIGFACLGGIDRMLGVLLGLLKTVIVIYMVLVGGLLLAPVVEPMWMSHSDVLIHFGRQWPRTRRLLINVGALSRLTELPDGTLEQILRPYRRGNGAEAVVEEAREYTAGDRGEKGIAQL